MATSTSPDTRRPTPVSSWLTRRLDWFVKASLGKQLLSSALLVFCAFLVIWALWLLLISPFKPEGSDAVGLYDMFSYSANPPDGKVMPLVAEKLGVILLYLLGSAFLSGVLITTFVNWIDRRKERWLKGEVKYNQCSDFILIIGGHNMVGQLCADLLERHQGEKKLVIQTRRLAELLRKDLQSVIGERAADEVMIYTGDRTSREDLALVNADCADEIYIIGENHRIDGNDHDAYTMDCLAIINEAFSHKEKAMPPLPDSKDTSTEAQAVRELWKPVKCHVMMEYQASTKIFQYTDLPLSALLDFIPFNFYEKWAEKVLAEPKALIGHAPTELMETSKRVHLIVIGMSKMGTMLAAQAALRCHFPNFFLNGSHPRTLITFIDRDASLQMDYFKGRNPALFHLARWRYVDASEYLDSNHIYCPKDGKEIYLPTFEGVDPMAGVGMTSWFKDNGVGTATMDIDWEFLQGDVGSAAIQQYLHDAAADADGLTTIAVCLPVTFEAVSASMFLPESVYLSPSVLRILVQQEATDAIIEAVSRPIEASKYKDDEGHTVMVDTYHKLQPFGMLNRCNYLAGDDLVPKVVHYIYCETYNINSGALQLPASERDAYWHSRFSALAASLCKEVDRLVGGSAADVNSCPTLLSVEEEYRKISNSNGKSIQAKRWSNLYNAVTIGVKCEVYGLKPSSQPLDITSPAERQIVEQLCIVEQNRWNFEQILIGYRPKKKGDERKYSKHVEEKDDYKLRRIHLDFCPYEHLDEQSKIYNRGLSLMLPVLYYISESLKKKSSNTTPTI